MKRTLGLLALVWSAFIGLSLSSCSYVHSLEEFDSVAGWTDPLNEPESVAWQPRPLLYPWYRTAVTFGLADLDPVPDEVDNPSGFARERLIELADWMGDDPTRVAQVARRMLWVVEKDPNSLNRITAIRGLERILRVLGRNPLAPEAYFEEVDAAKGLVLESRFRSAHETIQRMFSRTEPSLTEAQRGEYVRALQDYVAVPVPRSTWRRQLIRTIWTVYFGERAHPDVRLAAHEALQQAVYYAVCNGLRSALVPLDDEDFPAVRIEALLVFRRIGGIPAVPFVLQMMARPRLGNRALRYDRDVQVRMALVRVCGQLSYEHASAGTPKPLEFLYETAADEDEDGDVRRVALEGLGRCLAAHRGERRVSLELSWAKEWWKQYVTSR